ncbi:CpsD/CapB family tyrosine-protein kinase [Phaeovulum sp.]|uniref:CpsD/CapB family tyrosine-protein kinase n=1 Tax=Phaeovulum sp. TaxID=2934796 RepID=UPI0039E4D617
MERLQSAIDKARARRKDDRPKGQAVPIAAQPHQLPESLTLDAWAGIPEFVPQPDVMRRNRVLTFAGGGESTPFDMLRTKVLQQMRANNWRRLAVTSPGGACGKTTVCANLAFSLARQSDIRTLMIDMDMRRPALARTLGIEREGLQFSKALEGRADPLVHMRRYGSNLAVGLCEAPIRAPSELLQSDTAHAVLNDLERRLDVSLTIFDMPPMLATDDVLAFVGNVDCVLLVAAAESTTTKEVDICERDLAAQTNVLGVVLNKCRYPENDHNYDYYE